MEACWHARLKQAGAACLLHLDTASQQEVEREKGIELRNQVFYQEGREGRSMKSAVMVVLQEVS
jgi:hypothetical protein